MHRLRLRTLFLGLSCIGFAPSIAVGQDLETLLVLKPNRCIALHQGQTCYQEVVFRWEAQDAQHNYCIVEQESQKPLHCWLGGSPGKFAFDFGSDRSTRFQLQRDDGVVMTELDMVVAWVYKSRRKRGSGWRLF